MTTLTLSAIILIDPTPENGYRLLGGYDSFENWSSVEQAKLPKPPRSSLYEDVIYWMSRMNEEDIKSIAANSKACAMPAIKLILSDWQHVIQYITAQLGRIEWEIEIPAMRKQESGIASTMQKLHPWRRNISLYRSMVAQVCKFQTLRLACCRTLLLNIDSLHSPSITSSRRGCNRNMSKTL